MTFLNDLQMINDGGLSSIFCNLCKNTKFNCPKKLGDPELRGPKKSCFT